MRRKKTTRIFRRQNIFMWIKKCDKRENSNLKLSKKKKNF